MPRARFLFLLAALLLASPARAQVDAGVIADPIRERLRPAGRAGAPLAK